MKTTIAGLDHVRFLSAFSVMCSHFLPSMGVSAGVSGGLGLIGVSLFFTLSGFVIPFSAEGRSAAHFAESRAVRLLPGVWIAATISLLALLYASDAAVHGPILGRYIRTMLMVPAVPWHVESLGEIWVSSVYWTLFVEIVFYAVVAALIASGRLARIGQLASVLGLMSLAFWGAWFAASLSDPATSWRDPVMALEYKRTMDLGLVTHGACFGIGINLWLIMIKGRTDRALSLVLCLAGATLDMTHGLMHEQSPVIIFLLATGGGLILMVAAIRHPHVALLPKAWVRLIGLTTYPLYLLHIPVGLALASLGHMLGLGGFPTLFIMLLGCTLLAGFVAKVLEPALQQAFRRVLARFRGEKRQGNVAG